MEKRNILFLAHNFSVGGVQVANMRMIKHIDKDIFNVHVLYVNKGLYFSEVKDLNIQIKNIGKKSKLKSLSTIKHIFTISSYIKKNKIEIVHSIDPTFYVIAATAARITKIKHIRTQPNFIQRHEKLNSKTINILPFAKWTHHFIAYNKGSKNDLKLVGVDENKITVLYGLSIQEINSNSDSSFDLRKEFGLPPHNKIIIAMHRMVENKGFDVFLEMIPYIVKEYRAVSFLLVGDGYLRNKLELKVKELEIEDFVVFTGFRKDIVDISKQITFGVYPKAESAAMGTILKAGKILLTKKNSAMDEYIEDSKTGFLLEGDDPKIYGEFALKLLKNDDLLKSLEENQKEFAYKMFNTKINMKKFENLIIKILEN